MKDAAAAEATGAPAAPPSEAVRSAYELAAATAVAPAALGVGLVCLGYAPLHLFVTTHGLPAVLLATSAAVSGVLSLAVFARLRRRAIGPGRAHPWLAALIVLSTWNCALNMALTGDAVVTTNFVIVIIGVGVCMVSLRWVAAMVAVVTGSWLAVVLAQPHPPQWLQAGATVVGGIALAFVLNVSRRRSLAALAEARERAEHASVVDPLTGLYNRRGFTAVGGRQVRSARRTAPTVSVAVIDVDRFKSINDSLGHEAGDRVLEQIGSALTACFRESDVVSRWGGDEFAVVSTGRLGSAEELAARINAAIALLAVVSGLPGITVSVGLACAAPASMDEHELDALFAAADRDMYERRARRRGQPAGAHQGISRGGAVR